MIYTYVFFIDQDRRITIIGQGTNIHEAFHDARLKDLEEHKNNSNYDPITRNEVYGFLITEGPVKEIQMEMDDNIWN